jgi:hypothetical protein
VENRRGKDEVQVRNSDEFIYKATGLDRFASPRMLEQPHSLAAPYAMQNPQFSDVESPT